MGNEKKLTTSPSTAPETIDVLLTEHGTPTAFKRKLQELINDGLTEQEARQTLHRPIELELIYEPDNGLFAVESEAIGCSVNLCSPYSKTEIIEDEN